MVNRIINNIKLRENVLLLFLLFANYGFGAELWEITNAKKKAEKFVLSGDTSGLNAALRTLNLNFAQSKNSELLELMLKVSEKEAQLNKKALKDLYFILRQFYQTETTKTKNFEYSLKIYKILSQTEDYKGVMWMLIDIGNIFYSESDYDQALVYYQKAEKAAKKAQFNYGLSIIYLNYGMIDEQNKDYRKALAHYRMGSIYRLKSDNVKIVSSNYIKMAMVYLKINQPDSCLHYIHLTEHYYYNKGQETYLVKDLPFYIHKVYADYHMYRNEHEKAISYIQKAEKYCQDNKLIEELIACHEYESTYLFKAKKYEKSVAKVLEFLPMFKAQGLLNEQKFVYRMLMDCYSELKQFQKATEASEKYVLIDDSIHKHQIRSELSMIRSIAAVYESEARLNRIKKNLQMEKVTNHIQQKQRNASAMIASFSILAMLILAGLFFNSRRNKRTLVSLHGQLVHKNQEIKFNSLELKRSNQLKDNLFSIIGNDLRNPLHKMLEELKAVKSSVGEHKLIPIENTLKETITLFEGLLEWSRTGEKQNIFSPMKVNLDENINKIILFYLPEIQARSIKIINKSTAHTTFADQNIVQTLLRNLLGNAIAAVSKNGINQTIEIATELKNENIEITVSDSGKGFPQEILDKFYEDNFDVNVKSKGLGLSICKALTKISGWKMELSNNGKFNGAKVSVHVPLFKENMKAEIIKNHRNLSQDSKNELIPLKSFKFYQTSEIRLFVKNMEVPKDPSAQEWIRLLQKSVHDGDRKAYEALIELIN